MILSIHLIFIQKMSIGEVWLRVVVEKKNNLSMQMWATDKKTYAKAINGSDKLNILLNDAGLKVSSFDVFNEERPGPNKNKKKINLF